MASLNDRESPFNRQAQERARLEAAREKKAAEEHLKREQDARKRGQVAEIQRKILKIKADQRRSDALLAEIERELRLSGHEEQGIRTEEKLTETERQEAIGTLASESREITALEKEVGELDAEEKTLRQKLEEAEASKSITTRASREITALEKEVGELDAEEKTLRQKLEEAEASKSITTRASREITALEKEVGELDA